MLILTSRSGGALNRIPNGAPRLNERSYQADSLLGWWPGNVDAGQLVVRDYSGHGYHSSWTTGDAGPLTNPAGPMGTVAPTTNGTADEPIGDAQIPELEGANHVTFMTWFRRSVSSAYAGIGYGRINTQRFNLAAWTSGRIYANLNGDNDYISHDDLLWHHGVITLEGTLASSSSRVKMWIDGVERDVTGATYGTSIYAHSGNRMAVGQPVNVAGSSNLRNDWLDARAYTRTWSDEEVKDLYHRARWDLWDRSHRVYMIPAAAAATVVVANLAQWAWTANAADVASTSTISANLAQWSWTPNTATVALERSISANLAQWAWTPNTAGVSTDAAISISANLAQWSWTPNTATVAADRTISANLAQWTWSANTAGVASTSTIGANLAQWSWSANGATVQFDVDIAANLAQWSWTANAADVASSANVFRTGDAQTQALADLATFIDDTGAYGSIGEWMDLEMGFAESVFIGATELGGIFDDDSASGGDRLGPRVMMKTSDIVDNSIDQGTALDIRSRTFYVRGVQRDGTGISTVVLEE